MRRLVALAPIAVFALLVAVFGLYALHHNPQVIPRATVGSPPDGDFDSEERGCVRKYHAAAKIITMTIRRGRTLVRLRIG